MFDFLNEIESGFYKNNYPNAPMNNVNTFYNNEIKKYENPIKEEDLNPVINNKKENFSNDSIMKNGITLNFSITIKFFHIILFCIILLLYSLVKRSMNNNIVFIPIPSNQ